MILKSDRQLETVPGLRYKAERNHDLVYWEMGAMRELRGSFREIELEPRFIGARPDELRSKSQRQSLGA